MTILDKNRLNAEKKDLRFCGALVKNSTSGWCPGWCPGTKTTRRRDVREKEEQSSNFKIGPLEIESKNKLLEPGQVKHIPHLFDHHLPSAE